MRTDNLREYIIPTQNIPFEPLPEIKTKNARKPEVKKYNLQMNLDGVGFATSVLCAIHCAALPFVLSFLPMIGLQVLADPWIEYTVTGISIIVSILSFVPAYRDNHHKIAPIVFLITGLTLILFTHFLSLKIVEQILIPAGALTIAAAHFMNWKLSKTKGCPCCEHSR